MPIRNGENTVVLESQALTGGSAITTDPLSCQHAEQAVVVVKTSAKSGTSPAINWDFETSMDGGATWSKHTDYAAISNPTVSPTDVVQARYTIIGQMCRMRAPVGMEGSSTPSLTQAIEIYLKD